MTPSISTYENSSQPTKQESFIGYLSTVLVERLEFSERMILITELRNHFDQETLRPLLFYRSLHSGTALCRAGTRYSYDCALTNLINGCEDPYGRERLQAYFKGLIHGEPVCYLDPSCFEGNPFEELSRVGSSKTSLYDSGNMLTVPIPKLDAVLPDLEKYNLNKDVLNVITQCRMQLLESYYLELDQKRSKHPQLKHNSQFSQLAGIMSEVNTQTNTLFTVDIEAYEFDHSLITEIGIAIYDPAKDGLSLQPTLRNFHILIEENIKYRNGARVPDNKAEFLGGTSIVLPKEKALELVQCLMDYYFIYRPRQRGIHGVFVGHSFEGDLKWLRQLGVILPKNMKCIDTQKLYALSEGPSRRSSLGHVLRRYDIQHSKLHNGGNDAYYTLVLLLKLCDPQFRRERAVDCAESSRIYSLKVEKWQSTPLEDVFEGAKPNPPERSHIVYESVPPVKLRTCAAALEELFGLESSY